MEREREKDLLEELNKLRRQVQEQKARRDNLLRLIKKLQQLQALGPPAQGARSPSVERATVAQHVTRYLQVTDTVSGNVASYSPLRAAPSQSGTEPSRLCLINYSHLVREGKVWYACQCSTTGKHAHDSAANPAWTQLLLLNEERCCGCGSSDHLTSKCESLSKTY